MENATLASHLGRYGLELLRVVSIAAASAIVGAGAGFVQGEIVARGGDKIYQITFAGGAAMIGAFVALFLGPILYYSLKRRMLFEEFCYVCVLSVGVGCVVGWLISAHPNEPGWASMFVTPIAAIIFGVLFVRNPKSEGADKLQ